MELLSEETECSLKNKDDETWELRIQRETKKDRRISEKQS